jgi:hypothetical protein
MMAHALLVLNGGSSNLKFSVFLDDDRPTALLRGQNRARRPKLALRGAR